MKAADREVLQSGSSLLSTFMDRHTWRSGVRPAMCAASELSGRGPLMGPTDVDVAPLPAWLSKIL